LAWMFGYNIMPDSLRAKLNIIDPESPAAKAAADFFGRTNVILVDEQLLLQQGKQTGAANSEKSRMKIVLSELFEAARREYAKGMGNRTIFVFDEVALLNDEVLHEFKRLSDNGGYSPRGYRDLDSKDGGYHII